MTTTGASDPSAPASGHASRPFDYAGQVVLVLQGGGDPLMNIERWWRLVSDLRQTGLKRID